jgi:hypothetical protein
MLNGNLAVKVHILSRTYVMCISSPLKGYRLLFIAYVVLAYIFPNLTVFFCFRIAHVLFVMQKMLQVTVLSM